MTNLNVSSKRRNAHCRTPAWRSNSLPSPIGLPTLPIRLWRLDGLFPVLYAASMPLSLSSAMTPHSDTAVAPLPALSLLSRTPLISRPLTPRILRISQIGPYADSIVSYLSEIFLPRQYTTQAYKIQRLP